MITRHLSNARTETTVDEFDVARKLRLTEVLRHIERLSDKAVFDRQRRHASKPNAEHRRQHPTCPLALTIVPGVASVLGMPKASRTLLSVQYLRAAAALVVVVAHTGWTNPLWGQAGVDVFFLISGFIMVHVSQRETTPGAFMLARALRIVPLYWLVTLFIAATGPGVPWDHLILSLAFLPHISPEGMIWPVILHGWTLLFEVYFYVAFALALVLPARLRLLTLTAVLGALSIVGAMSGRKDAVAQVYLAPVLLEFLAGAWLHRAWQRGWLANRWLCSSFLLVSVGAFITGRNIDPDGWRVVMWGIPSLLLLAGALGLERHLPRFGPALLLGNASYALYLVHRIPLPFLTGFLKSLPGPIALAGVLAGSAAIGIAVHLFLELPVTAQLKRSLTGRVPPAHEAAPPPRAGSEARRGTPSVDIEDHPVSR